MAIDDLTELIPMPKIKVDPAARAAVEKKLGVQLPSDYWDLITTFGAGSFMDYVEDEEEDEFFVDFEEDNGRSYDDDFSADESEDDEDDDDDDDDDDFDDDEEEDDEGAYEIPFEVIATDKKFADWVSRSCEALKLERQRWETDYELFPTRPGLLPFTMDEDGGILAWYMDGDSDEWPIMAKHKDGEWQRFDMPITTFLARTFQGKIAPEIWNTEGRKHWNLERLRFIPRD